MKTKTKPELRSPRITAKAPGQWLWDLFKDYQELPRDREHWNFQLMVVVDSFMGPLNHRYEHILDMGVGHLRAVYAQKPLPESRELMFIFPDRWLTPRFAISFNHLLNKNPTVVAANKAGRRMKILTVCFQPYIVADCMKEQVMVIRDSEENPNWQPDIRSLWGIPADRW